MLNKSKDMLEENYTISAARGRAVVEHTASAISSGAEWLSEVIDKASKRASDLTTKKTDNPNYRKQK